MIPTIYLVRHGETEWNRDGRMQGQRDAPLTGRGRAQVRAAGRMLARRGISGLPVWVSPLGRTRATASILAEEMTLGPVTLEPRLQEIALGSWEGRTATEIAAANAPLLDGIPRSAWGFHCPDGEGFQAGSARVAAWLRERHEPEVIVVAHGMVGRVLRAICTGLAPEEAMTIQVPQDRIWCLQDGGLCELPVESGETAFYKAPARVHSEDEKS